MTLFPFILIANKKLKEDKVFVNHERIHLRQQIEMLVIPFYVVYMIHYLVNRVKLKDHNKAYRNIVFEREAYSNEKNMQYLAERRIWAWFKYFKK